MSDGKWWLVTCTTFGTWLPGDPRGFQTWRGREYVPPPKRYAKKDEASYRPKDYAQCHEVSNASLSESPVRFTKNQQETVATAIVRDIADTPLIPAIFAVGDVHLHLLAKFGSLRIKSTMGRYKAAATAQLHLDDIDSDRVWTRGCHMKSKGTRDEFVSAFRYVKRHENEGCIVHVWDNNIPDDCRFLLPPIPFDELPF